MNMLKNIIGFVIAILVIPIIVISVDVATQTKTVEKDLTFELFDLGSNNTFSFNVYDKISEYAVIDNEDDVINLVSATVNNVDEFELPSMVVLVNDYNLANTDGEYREIDIYSDNSYNIMGDLNIGDTITLTFDVEVETPLIIKTLLTLIPLIFVSGIVSYYYFNRNNN